MGSKGREIIGMDVAELLNLLRKAFCDEAFCPEAFCYRCAEVFHVCFSKRRLIPCD